MLRPGGEEGQLDGGRVLGCVLTVDEELGREAGKHERITEAVGQRADGRILLVAVDGRQPGYSTGMTTFELAQTMVRLGAVTASSFDAGGSTTMAFEGKLLNSPSDPGGERAVAGSHLLVAAGRAPNSDPLNLAAAGVTIDARGFIAVNDRLETDVAGIYALGDVKETTDRNGSVHAYSRDVLGRRTDKLNPSASLILQKGLGRIPHEGGSRFAADSVPAKAITSWLAEGLRDDRPNLPALKKSNASC